MIEDEKINLTSELRAETATDVAEQDYAKERVAKLEADLA
ncbi:nucleotide exchange factor GrpE, partial [Pseudomonas sp. FW305-130]